MKKVLVCILSALLFCSVTFSAYAEATSVEYRDEETKTTFIVPSGWRFAESEELGYEADFVFLHEESEKDYKDDEEEDAYPVFITYNSYDYYSSLSDNSKSREDVNLDSLSVKELADYIGIKETKLQKATYNRTDYYRFTSKAKKFTSLLDKEQRVTGYITVQNGYIYQIMFFDGTTSDIYGDFKSFMGSIVIEGKTPEIEKKEKLLTPGKIISIAVLIAALAGFIIVLIKTKK